MGEETEGAPALTCPASLAGRACGGALRAFVYDQGEESAGPDHHTIEERQRCQSQETPEPRYDEGQELERQGATDGKREIGIRR